MKKKNGCPYQTLFTLNGPENFFRNYLTNCNRHSNMLKNFRPKLLLKKTWKEFKDFHGVLNLNSCKYLQRYG